MASGQQVPIDKQAKVLFQVRLQYSQESFSFLRTLIIVFRRCPYFEKYKFGGNPKKKWFQSPDLAVQLNPTLPVDGKKHLIRRKCRTTL